MASNKHSALPNVLDHRLGSRQPPARRESGPSPVFDDIPDTAIRAAAARVFVRAYGDPKSDVRAQDLSRRLTALGVAISTHVGGRPNAVDPALRGPLTRQLLSDLKVELAMEWLDQPGDAAPMRHHVEAVHRAFEHYEASVGIDPVAAPEPADGFRDQLASPRGLELTVEVAHDIRSPLTSILLLAETLHGEQSGPVSELQRRQLGLIYSAALGLSTLATNVIELARGGNRLSEDEPSPFSVVDLVDSVRDIVHPMVEEKGLTLRTPSPSTDDRIGPAHAIGRVLLNLVTNAIKFTQEGFVELSCRSTSQTGLEFSVRDSGGGINPEALETLFLPFRPAHDRTRYAFSETGLGLALCQRLLKAMGSELQYESSPGEGTRFFFELDLPAARRS